MRFNNRIVNGFITACAGGPFAVEKPQMDYDILDRIESRLEATGLTARQASIQSGNSADLIRNWQRSRLDGKPFPGKLSKLVELARVLGVTTEWLLGQDFPASSVAVAGKVGAGATVHLVDDHTKGDGLYHIACPPQIEPAGMVAVEVEGTSMEPVYQPGDILLYTRPALGVPTEALNRICIAEDSEGRAWVKQVKTGTAKGLFNLLSANPTGQNLLDVRLRWAAPVRLHLPAEFVRRV